MGLIFDFPINFLNGIPDTEARVIENAYLVVNKESISLAGTPSMRGDVFYSKALYDQGGATPIFSDVFYFAIAIKEDGKTYAMSMENPAISAPFQSGENGVVDIEATTYPYLQALLGGVIE